LKNVKAKEEFPSCFYGNYVNERVGAAACVTLVCYWPTTTNTKAEISQLFKQAAHSCGQPHAL